MSSLYSQLVEVGAGIELRLYLADEPLGLGFGMPVGDLSLHKDYIGIDGLYHYLLHADEVFADVLFHRRVGAVDDVVELGVDGPAQLHLKRFLLEYRTQYVLGDVVFLHLRRELIIAEVFRQLRHLLVDRLLFLIRELYAVFRRHLVQGVYMSQRILRLESCLEVRVFPGRHEIAGVVEIKIPVLVEKDIVVVELHDGGIVFVLPAAAQRRAYDGRRDEQSRASYRSSHISFPPDEQPPPMICHSRQYI